MKSTVFPNTNRIATSEAAVRGKLATATAETAEAAPQAAAEAATEKAEAGGAAAADQPGEAAAAVGFEATAAEVTATAAKASAEDLSERGLSNLLWPLASARRVNPETTQRPRSTHVDCVQAGAHFYSCFSCVNMDNGYPGRGIIMQLRSDMDTLHVKFKHGCTHYTGGMECGQLRRAARAAVVGEEDGLSAATKHGIASNGRTTDEKLARDISRCGTGSQVLQTAKCEVLKEEFFYHTDQFISIYLRKADMEKRYRQIIPGAVHNTILVFGDTPMVSYTHGLLILRMKNFSIMRWAVQRKAGRGMWVMDTKGGMVSVLLIFRALCCC